MPIPLPNLDDRTFDDLVAEARELIPVLHPDWTDHNPSDPGIVLVELLAWLTEMLLFQVNQIPEANTRKFLELLGGPGCAPPTVDLDEAIRQTMSDLHERYRAVTPQDYEYLVREIWPGTPEAAELAQVPAIRRVRCVPGRDLTATDYGASFPAHVSVVVVLDSEVAEPGVPPPFPPHPTEALTNALYRFLKPRRILTTRHHVVGPSYVEVGIAADLALHSDSFLGPALHEAYLRLRRFFHPLHGGAESDGWPFGRPVYASEVYAVLEGFELVDYIENVTLTGPKPIKDANGQVIGIDLDAHQLVRLTPVALTTYGAYGQTLRETWLEQS